MSIKNMILVFLLLLILAHLFHVLSLSYSVIPTIDFLFNFALCLPFIALFYVFFSKIFGYSLSDEGISRCKIHLGGWFPLNYIVLIKWKDVIRVEYKLARIKFLDIDENEVVVYSIYGDKIAIPDSQYAFQEILHTIQDKTKLNSQRFIINDSHKIIVFDNSDNVLKNDLRATEEPLQSENVKQLPMVIHSEFRKN